MSKAPESRRLVPSVLDRLIDKEPDHRRETTRSRSQMLRELRESVQRDLENLLNTRCRCTEWPPDLEQLGDSLIGYGIPDFTGANVSSPADRQQLRGVIAEAIRRFEPRFKSFDIQLLKNADPHDRTIRFRIDAMLYAHPAPEPVVFDSRLEPTTRYFEVDQHTR